MAEVTPLLLVDGLRPSLRNRLAEQTGSHPLNDVLDAPRVQRICQDSGCKVLLVDLEMPGSAAVEAVRFLLENCPEVKILALIKSDYGDFVRDLARAGVSGYLLKTEPLAAVLQAIRAIQEGGTWFSQEAISKMVGQDEAQGMLDLTEREQEVLGAVIRGWDNARIASELHLGEQTVRNYVSRVYEKLGVRTRAEAIVWAVKHGLVDRDM